MLTVEAPAKLNLTLEVLGKRDDGYHEIRSVAQTISLCDRLHFRSTGRMEYHADLPEWLAQQSLVPRAVDLLREATGCPQAASVDVEKRIPLMSGLGGDSSAAAAVLLGLNRLWDLSLSGEKLHQLAARLGSDVALFLHGGTVLMAGRGEKTTPLPSPPTVSVVVVVPDAPREPGKTWRAYASLRPEDFSDGQATTRLAETIRGGGEVGPSLLFNAFEARAFEASSELAACRDEMLDAGAQSVHLAGSGPALFALSERKAEAEDVYDRLRLNGIECYLAETLPARERLA